MPIDMSTAYALYVFQYSLLRIVNKKTKYEMFAMKFQNLRRMTSEELLMVQLLRVVESESAERSLREVP